MDFAVILSVISGLLQICGYVVYNRLSRKGEIVPDGASWGIWAFGSILNVYSYVTLTQDWVKDILPICCALSCMITFLARAYRKEFGKIDLKGWIILVLDLGITWVWYKYTTAEEASLLYQVSTIISFAPMILGLKNKTDKEDWRPWIIWTVAYCLWAVSVVMRLNNLSELAYPITCFVMHALMAFIARRNRS